MNRVNFEDLDNIEETIMDVANLISNKLGEQSSFVKELQKETGGTENNVLNVQMDLEKYIGELKQNLELALDTIAEIREWVFIAGEIS